MNNTRDLMRRDSRYAMRHREGAREREQVKGEMEQEREERG